MKHTPKRILSIFAAAALTICSLPQSTPLLLRPAITASAANKTYFDYEYSVSLDGSSTALAQYHGSDKTVEIPIAFEGLPVTEIKIYAFKDCSEVTDIHLNASVDTMMFSFSCFGAFLVRHWCILVHLHQRSGAFWCICTKGLVRSGAFAPMV